MDVYKLGAFQYLLVLRGYILIIKMYVVINLQSNYRQTKIYTCTYRIILICIVYIKGIYMKKCEYIYINEFPSYIFELYELSF